MRCSRPMQSVYRGNGSAPAQTSLHAIRISLSIHRPDRRGSWLFLVLLVCLTWGGFSGCAHDQTSALKTTPGTDSTTTKIDSIIPVDSAVRTDTVLILS